MNFLPEELRQAYFALPDGRRQQAMELRFRLRAPVKVVFPWGEEVLSFRSRTFPVTEKLLREVVDRATGFSPYSFGNQQGGLFLPLEGGCRLGLCGEATVKDGNLQGIRHLGSLVIRLAREHRGIAEESANVLTARGYPESVLIVSPPGMGKTTFLRDLIRCVSMKGFRVGVVDERWELGAEKNGVPQLDLGPCTDVLTGCKKAQGLPLLLRVMNPQVLAVDELGAEEVPSVMEAANCGVAVFATAHGASLTSVKKRPGFGAMLETGTFSWVITIRAFGKIHMERVEPDAENHGCLSCGAGFNDEWVAGKTAVAPAAFPPAAPPHGPGADAGGDGTEYAHGGGTL